MAPQPLQLETKTNKRYFQPLEVVKAVKNDYLRYLLTTFPVYGELRGALIERLLNDAQPWEGPFITISQPYKKGSLVRDVLSQLQMDNNLSSLMPHQFYRHQEQTIRNIVSGRNTIVTTGTGSGKTESFLLPILDYCIKHPEPGVKAILLYPMNSLAEDQADRLRKYLYILNPKINRRPITFARYTGSTPSTWDERYIGSVRCTLCDEVNTQGLKRCQVCTGQQAGDAELRPAILPNNNRVLICANESPPPVVVNYELLTREDIRNNMPDILITNYKMLDLLLMRNEDSSLFSENIRFVVVDELHSYLGAQGSELACLLRRLSSRIKNHNLQGPIFIGASATIVTDDSVNLKSRVAEYATEFFGSPVGENDIFTGEPEERVFSGDEYIHTIPDEDPGVELEDSKETFVRILSSIYSKDKIPTEIPDDLEERRVLLGSILQNNSLFRKLSSKLKRPRSLKDIEDELKEEYPDKHYTDKEILRILTLAAKAYDPSTKDTNIRMPFVRCQVHFLARTLDGVYKCTSCETLFFSPRITCPSCDGNVEALGVCRSCGAEFLRMELPEEDYRRYIEREADDIDRALNDSTPWIIQREPVMREPYGFSSTSVWISRNELPSDRKTKSIKIQLCLACGALKHNTDVQCCSKENTKDVSLFKKISSCPFCLDQRGPYSSPISTIYLSPRTAAPTLFALTHTATEDVQHRKQLIFSDSRQETARLAGFMDDLHRGILLRNLIYRTIKESSPSAITFNDLQQAVMERFFSLNYKDDEEDEIFGIERIRLERQIREELAGCFNKRYGIEKVGLISAKYDVLDNTKFIDDFNSEKNQLLKRVKELTNSTGETVCNALAMMLDHMRHEGGMKCLREFRQWATRPAAFVEQVASKKASLYYNVSGIKRKQRRKKGFYNHTVFTKFIEKTFGITDGSIQNEIVECLFKFLQQSRLLTEEDLGQSRRSGHRGRGWMVDESKISYSIPELIGICRRCGEKSARMGESVPCFTYKCNERTAVNENAEKILAENDIYVKRYSEESPVRLITAEDHGGLDDNYRKKIEASFKQGQIDVICCTPTLELGVDIGDLSLVGLYRTPPSPANYIQRVGRAGRREKISLAITFLAQNPIDQYYRRRPQEMIGGNVRLPYVNLENETVISRHVHSLILEILAVTDMNLQLSKRVIDFKNNEQHRILSDAVRANKSLLKQKIKDTFLGINWLTDWRIEKICTDFPVEIANAVEKWDTRRNQLLTVLNETHKKSMDANMSGKADEATEYMRRYNEVQRQLNEMQGEDRGESDLFSYLSGMGVLPTYTFPAKLVRIQDRWGKDLGNDRPACVAITEFAPGLNVDMRKTRYQVRGFDISTSPEPSGRTFYFCDSSKGGCNRYLSESHPSTCPLCGAAASKITEVRAWNPNGLVLDKEERISVRGDDVFKVADTEYFLLYPSAQQSHETEISINWAKLRDKGSSEIVLLVRKTSDMRESTGFDICPECGWCLQGSPVQHSATAQHNKLMDRRTQCPGRVEKKSLWHKFRTNSLEVTPNREILAGFNTDDRHRFLVTLKNALCRTAEIIINAAEGELDGFILKDSIVIFDNVDGGVGYTKQVINRIHEIEKEMAITILSCDCETGCPKCLYSSRRKIDIIRGNVNKILIVPLCQRILRTSLLTRQLPPPVFRKENSFEALGTGEIKGNVAGWFSAVEDKRPATWIRNLILMAREEICATSLYVTDDKLEWEDSGRGSFVELFSLAAARGLKVRIIVRPPSSDKHRRALMRMKENGVEIRTFSRPSGEGLDAIAHCKTLVIDGHIQSDTSAGITLSANLSKEVQKNVDFFCLGHEKQWITGLQLTFEKIWSDALPL